LNESENIFKLFEITVIAGLDDSLQRYEAHFRSAGVVGSQLLNLTYEDLANLRVQLTGHQELMLDAVSLLQQLVNFKLHLVIE